MPRLIGVDAGKSSLMLSWPADREPRYWPTCEIRYDAPGWHHDLLSLIDHNAIVCVEPTGAHLITPLAALLRAFRPDAQLYQVQGAITAQVRLTHVSRTKSDPHDARALAVIAELIAQKKPPLRVRYYHADTETAVQQLRSLINQHQRLTTASTRLKNRLNLFAFSIWPNFAGSATYERAISADAVSIAEVRALAASVTATTPGYERGPSRTALKRLAADLPDIPTDPITAATIRALTPELAEYTRQRTALRYEITYALTRPPFATAARRMATRPVTTPLLIAAILVACHAAILDMSRDDFVASVAHGPRTSRSGQINKTAANRKGYKPARALIHLAMMAIISHYPTDTVAHAFARHERKGTPHPSAAAKTKFCRELWGRARDDRCDYLPIIDPDLAAAFAGTLSLDTLTPQE